jgi:hypothetical protein
MFKNTINLFRIMFAMLQPSYSQPTFVRNGGSMNIKSFGMMRRMHYRKPKAYNR